MIKKRIVYLDTMGTTNGDVFDPIVYEQSLEILRRATMEILELGREVRMLDYENGRSVSAVNLVPCETRGRKS